MGREIERKFLVLNDDWRADADAGTPMSQAYLGSNPRCSVRVRIEGDAAKLNIKSATLGIERTEYEYTIPVADAREMLAQLCGGHTVEKVRYAVHCGAHVYEIDVFEGANAGLVVAEIELGHPDEQFVRPDWLGAEVSHDVRYYNVRLLEHPFRDWPEASR
ncbi:MAG: CYTH domain-containing protein [Gammaproteobacteria bacterium]|nr:CYTH domain-containing protein [Gammaproteobacteria bacterium]MBI5618134.1 CYTH domain-containing protein [Gammaproteobacteria bacterium]